MEFNPLGFSKPLMRVDRSAKAEFVQVQSALARVLAFTGKSIDDVVNDPIAKSQVLGYYKLSKWVGRHTEIGELERQWNGLRGY